MSDAGTMRIKALLPSEVLMDEEVRKIIAESENGSFCLLPRHIDFVAALTPGILTVEYPDGREQFIAVDEGMLVKCGREVLVSTRNAVTGEDLGALRNTIEEQFLVLDEREKSTRVALAGLEADFVQRFIDMEK